MSGVDWEDHSLAAAWDAAAPALQYDPTRPVRYRKCLRYFTGLRPDAGVCEVGCGDGTGLELLLGLGFRALTGVEVSSQRLSEARERMGDRVSLVEISPREPLPFADGSFDAVLAAAVIEHTLDPRRFLLELERIVRPGGYIVLSSDCYTFRLLQLLGQYDSAQPVDRALFPLTLIWWCSRSGLELVHCEGFPGPGNEFMLPRVLLERLRVVSMLRRTLPRRVRRSVRGALTSTEEPPPAERLELESWRPRHWASALPKLVFSEENVFFLRKRAP